MSQVLFIFLVGIGGVFLGMIFLIIAIWIISLIAGAMGKNLIEPKLERKGHD